MEGRRHGRGGGAVGDAGGCGARARRHVPTSRGRRRRAAAQPEVSFHASAIASSQSATHAYSVNVSQHSPTRFNFS